jgi:hypothetical protein
MGCGRTVLLLLRLLSNNSRYSRVSLSTWPKHRQEKLILIDQMQMIDQMKEELGVRDFGAYLKLQSRSESTWCKMYIYVRYALSVRAACDARWR